MKKLLLILVAIVVLALSCESSFLDDEGLPHVYFGIIRTDKVVTQSRSLFTVGDMQYTAYGSSTTYVVLNPHNEAIDIRISTVTTKEWVTIAPHASYIVGDTL